MRNYIILFAVLIFASCDNPGDCVKSTGAMTVKSYDMPEFSKIVVNKGIALVIRQGGEYKVEVHSGENLINDIEVTVDGGLLRLADNTSCNWTREYGETIVYVTTPELTDVYSKTELSISSDGVLAFPELHLVAMDSYDGYVGVGTGDYRLELNNTSTFVDANSVARFYLSGHTQNLKVSVYAAGSIVYGQDLIAQNVHVFHRGTNDIYVHPLMSLSGDLYSLGDLYSTVHPPVVNVIQHYDGRLIFY